jgi:hypothetical protein
MNPPDSKKDKQLKYKFMWPDTVPYGQLPPFSDEYGNDFGPEHWTWGQVVVYCAEAVPSEELTTEIIERLYTNTPSVGRPGRCYIEPGVDDAIAVFKGEKDTITIGSTGTYQAEDITWALPPKLRNLKRVNAQKLNSIGVQLLESKSWEFGIPEFVGIPYWYSKDF